MRSSDQASQDRIVLQDATSASSYCPAALVFRQQMSVVTQLVLVVFGLPCLLPFYQLVMLTDIGHCAEQDIAHGDFRSFGP